MNIDFSNIKIKEGTSDFIDALYDSDSDFVNDFIDIVNFFEKKGDIEVIKNEEGTNLKAKNILSNLSDYFSDENEIENIEKRTKIFFLLLSAGFNHIFKLVLQILNDIDEGEIK